jgi:hypothetical protein
MVEAASSPGPRVVAPTIIVGLDDAWAEIVEPVKALADSWRCDANEHAVFLPARSNELVGSDFQASVANALPSFFDIRHVMRLGTQFPGWKPPLDVFLVARLEATGTTPEALADAVRALRGAFAKHRRSLGERARQDRRANLTLILLLPPMQELVRARPSQAPGTTGATDATEPVSNAEAQDGEQSTAEVLFQERIRDRLRAWASEALVESDEVLPFGRCYLAEHSAGDYELREPDRQSMTQAFLRFLLYASVRREESYQGAYQATGDRDLFASFLVGNISAPPSLGAQLKAYVRLTALEAFADTPPPEAPGDARWLDGLPSASAGSEAVEALSKKHAPIAPPTPAYALDSKKTLHDRFEAWRAKTRAALEAACSDAISASVPSEAQPLLSVIRDKTSRSLGTLDGAVHGEVSEWLARGGEHHAHALVRLERAADALTDARKAPSMIVDALDPGPDLAAFDAACAPVRAAIDQKPDVAPMLVVGSGLWLASSWLGAGALWLLSHALSPLFTDPPGWLESLRGAPQRQLVAATLSLVLLLSWLASKLWAHARAVDRTLGTTEPAPPPTPGIHQIALSMRDGATRSVRAYLESRRRLAAAHGRLRALREIERAARTEVDALASARAAVEAQRARLRSELAELADRSPGGAQAAKDESPLVRELLSPAQAATLAADVAANAWAGKNPVARVKEWLAPYAERLQRLPFGDVAGIEVLDAERRSSTVGLLGDDSARATVLANLSRFVREMDAVRDFGGLLATGRRLSLPLWVDLRDDEIQRPKGGWCLLHAELKEALTSRLPEAPTDVAQAALRAAVDGSKSIWDDKAIYLMEVVWGISSESIVWMREDEPPARAPLEESS